MGVLAEKLAEVADVNPHAKTTNLHRALSTMDADDRVAVLEALANKDVAASVLSRVLAENGFNVGDSVIRRFRSKPDLAVAVEQLRGEL